MKYLKFLPIFFCCALLLAFNLKITVSGIIVNQENNPIAFAVVQEKSTNNAVTADAQGKFSISVSGIDARLIISAAGYIQKEIKAGTYKNLVIKLAGDVGCVDEIPTNNALQEVVVIGYGTHKKETLVGAATTIAPTNAGFHHQNMDVRLRPGLPGYQHLSREGYDHLTENPFLKSKDNPLSTFSIDVDGASYSNIRRFINDGQLPPPGAVRIEEMINYFSYNYPQPTGDAPFSINTEYTVCPWNTKHQLVSIGLQGKKIPTHNLPASNLVFLIDVSGSMSSADKLPLVQSSMKLLTNQLRPQDRVAIVVYAGSAGLVLPSTAGNESIQIKNAIDRLQAGGSTAGGAGIELAYKTAQQYFINGGNNRVILCTDGDFNVGQSSDDALERMIEEKRKSGVFLTVLGFGTGNYQDAKMQKLANKGNGNHAYIDNLNEARKTLISQFGGTLFTIAKDVKLQVEFNPAKVQGYRLIGYENRMLAKEDFNDDKKDAGELGSGHTVTALYEIIPVGIDAPELKKVDDLKYQKPAGQTVDFNNADEIMTVKFRYKKPDGDKSLLLQQSISGKPNTFNNASEDMHLASSLAQFGMLLRQSEYKGSSNYDLAGRHAAATIKNDKEGYRAELMQLLKHAESLHMNSDIDVNDNAIHLKN